MLEKGSLSKDNKIPQNNNVLFNIFNSICSAPGRVEEFYKESQEGNYDCSEHVKTLYKLARDCEHVTELGTHRGNSTIAFVRARPFTMHTYDIKEHPRAKQIEALALCMNINFHYHIESTIDTTIEETDLLFVDSLHVYDQVKKELELHGNKAKKYLVFHDTETWGKRGEFNNRGILDAIDEFMKSNKHWNLKKHYSNNNGLTIYEQKKKPISRG
jgi:hypothetical protein